MTEGNDLPTDDLVEQEPETDDLFDDPPRRRAGLGWNVTDAICDHPELALALALAFGAIVGLVVKRR